MHEILKLKRTRGTLQVGHVKIQGLPTPRKLNSWPVSHAGVNRSELCSYWPGLERCKSVRAYIHVTHSTLILQANFTNGSHTSAINTADKNRRIIMASLAPILASLTDADLQRLFTANTAAGTPSVRLAGGARKVHISGTAAAHAWASDNQLHNGVSHVVLAPGDDPVQAVRAVTQEGLLLTNSEGKAVGPCHWVLGPAPQPDLERALLAHGFVLDHEEPAMAAPLEEDEEELIGRYEQAVTRVGEGFDITPVEDGNAETLVDWMTAWGSGMRSIEVMESWKAVYMVMLRELPRSEFSMFVGRVHGRAVGTGIMYRAEGVAAVHYITTLPEFRKRGIGTALTLHAMVLARRFGCRIAMLTASQIGIGVYRSLGFREFGLQKIYLWDGNVDGSLKKTG